MILRRDRREPRAVRSGATASTTDRWASGLEIRRPCSSVRATPSWPGGPGAASACPTRTSGYLSTS